eukprot:4728729-Pleurochrysis_carterae.AAC.1
MSQARPSTSCNQSVRARLADSIKSCYALLIIAFAVACPLFRTTAIVTSLIAVVSLEAVYN